MDPCDPLSDGVSNGDVDWLFRGKQKKPAKKQDGDGKKEEKKSTPSSTTKEPKGTASPPPAPPPSTSSSSTSLPEKSSKLDKFKFGRSRSSSVQQGSAPSPPPNEPPKRRGSVNLGSLRNLGSSNQPSNQAGVSRSNSGSKRSLFSSISSKLKAGAQYQAPGSTVKGDTPPVSRPLHHHQDLTLIDKLPMTMGSTPGRRRGSSVVSRESLPPRVVLNKNPHREELPLKELKGVRLERVVFAIDQLVYDPQQQIPSRRPKKGNVLVPEDLVAPPPRLSMGISLSDGGKLAQEPSYSDRELQLAIDSQRRAIVEADKHAYEAHIAAKRLAQEVALGKKFWLKNDDPATTTDEDIIDDKAGQLEIELPMHHHESHFGDEVTANEDESLTLEDLSLEAVYTRCCHLREILPIPATLKQLKGKSKPLQVLKMLNPKPTLIDVLSFADFIAITPINTVIFDNVTMTTEMLKHFLASLVNNKHLEKLSLRNVAIDADGWMLLCKFLSRNTTVKKLDISQQKIKSDDKQQCVRGKMNWSLLIKALELRGGIEELVMNGCKLDDETFADLITRAVSLNTYRLGIAGTELDLAKAQVIADWMSAPNTKCIGVDIAFNDLTDGQLEPFKRAFNTGKCRLVFFSLHSTGLTDADQTASVLRSLANVPTLRFLDLSSLPEIFPKIIGHLYKILPIYPALRRIHFDLDDLSAQSIGAIAEILPLIKNLVHVSLLGNGNLNHRAAGSLYQAIKSSSTIHTLEMDSDQVPEDLAQKIAFYLMRNLDRSVNIELHDGDEELIFDGSLLMERAEKLMVESESTSNREDPKVQSMITKALIERTRAARLDIHTQIDKLFVKRKQGTLSLEGKETLLRLCILDTSLERVVKMFEEYAHNHGMLSVSVSPQSSSVDLKALAAVNQQSIADALAKSDRPQITLHSSTNEVMTTAAITGPRQTPLHSINVQKSTADQLHPHHMVSDTDNGRNLTFDKETGRPVLMRSASQTSVHGREQAIEEGEVHKKGFQKQAEELNVTNPKRILSVPSGLQLRDAVMADQNIDSVTELLDRIKTDKETSPNQYDLDDIASIDSLEDAMPQSHNPEVDAIYEKLLNEAAKVRSRQA